MCTWQHVYTTIHQWNNATSSSSSSSSALQTCSHSRHCSCTAAVVLLNRSLMKRYRCSAPNDNGLMSISNALLQQSQQLFYDLSIDTSAGMVWKGSVQGSWTEVTSSVHEQSLEKESGAFMFIFKNCTVVTDLLQLQWQIFTIRPIKSWVLVCWWWQFDWSFACLTALDVITSSIILSSNKMENGDDILVQTNPGSPRTRNQLSLTKRATHMCNIMQWRGWPPKTRPSPYVLPRRIWSFYIEEWEDRGEPQKLKSAGDVADPLKTSPLIMCYHVKFGQKVVKMWISEHAGVKWCLESTCS